MLPERLSMAALTEATERFRDWSRTNDGVLTLVGVAEGALWAENELIRVFVESINPPEDKD